MIEERAMKAAEEFGVEGAKAYSDYHELLDNPEVEVVHICTPNVSHSEIVMAAFVAKKHVYCDKPMSHNTEEAEKLRRCSLPSVIRSVLDQKFKTSMWYVKKGNLEIFTMEKHMQFAVEQFLPGCVHGQIVAGWKRRYFQNYEWKN